MSARRDILFAVGLCLLFSLLSINARSLEEISVKTKRDTDWWTILEDILYDNDSDSDDVDDEHVLICHTCTVVVQAAPNATADGSTAAPQAAPGSSPGAPATPPGSTPGAPAPVAPETPAPSAPATSPQPAVTAPPTAAPPTSAPPTAAPGG
ncbi:4-O-methyl-glucuronoyl methylesterase 1 [Drosophila sechellia]|uniref:GM23725 n=1 Tax=Drosophila sechellia TaxID=7238 RepID=B4HLL4_DROSE|nr:4-O-methyl-glucuronoyl methylesterase 1 [Drosophila sechellia]EDW43041.1 GM23725 [Drosophila sechellia]